MNLLDIPALDHHAHNLFRPEIAAECSYLSAFTESSDPAIGGHHAAHTLFVRRSLRDIAGLLDCGATEPDIVARRSELGFVEVARRCFDAAHLEAVFLDDGLSPERILPWEWHRRFVPVRRILRLESLAESLLASEADFDSLLDKFRARLDPPGPEVIALKSIAAYRSGLDMGLPTHAQARSSFKRLKEKDPEGPYRLTAKPLIDFLLSEALRLAARHHLPIQFHTGFGDPDLDLRLANPLHLRTLLEEPAWRSVPIVLLHAGYPFIREAGYLVSVYPQVYVDFGLTVPFLSVSGMRSVLTQLLELAPTTKLMYSSDAHMIPELFYLASKWGRGLLAEALEGAVSDGDLTAAEAEAAAERILRENARRLYDVSQE